LREGLCRILPGGVPRKEPHRYNASAARPVARGASQFLATAELDMSISILTRAELVSQRSIQLQPVSSQTAQSRVLLEAGALLA